MELEFDPELAWGSEAEDPGRRTGEYLAEEARSLRPSVELIALYGLLLAK